MKTKRLQVTLALAAAVLALSLVSCSHMSQDTFLFESRNEDIRTSIQDMASYTLNQLARQYPEVRSRLKNAAGYAAFSNFGIKYLMMGSANGQGIAKNKVKNKETFMKMVELEPGSGFGVQQFKTIFLFDTQDDLNTFVNSGWVFDSDAAAAAQASTQGMNPRMGAAVSPGVTMYQLNAAGAVVAISIKGARYYRDDLLN